MPHREHSGDWMAENDCLHLSQRYGAISLSNRPAVSDAAACRAFRSLCRRYRLLHDAQMRGKTAVRKASASRSSIGQVIAPSFSATGSLSFALWGVNGVVSAPIFAGCLMRLQPCRYCRCERRAGNLGGPFDLTGQIVSHHTVLHGGLKRISQLVRRFFPCHMIEHHGA